MKCQQYQEYQLRIGDVLDVIIEGGGRREEGGERREEGGGRREEGGGRREEGGGRREEGGGRNLTYSSE